MRALFKLLFLLIILSPFALAAGLWFALSEQPLVTQQIKLSHADIARAQKILKKNDPRNMAAGTQRRIGISEQDLNLASNYLLQKVTDGSARVRVLPEQLDAVATMRIPHLPVKPYLNLTLLIDNSNGDAKISELQLGALKIPPFLAHFVLKHALASLYQTHEYQLASNLVKQVSMQPGQLLVTYEWNPELMKQARSTLLSGGDRQALEAYHSELLRLQDKGIGTGGSLVKLTQPMFSLALSRSQQNDAVTENLALLSVLGAWAGKRGLEQLVPEAKRSPKGFRLSLERRRDFGQHFLLSAALAARGDGALSDAVGLFKELSDSDGGSGFSFTDIAADRAGSRFGDLATRSVDNATRVQKLMSQGVAETDIMPKARDLPEHMTAAEFQRRFGGVGSAAYERIMDDIEQRIASCRMYRK